MNLFRLAGDLSHLLAIGVLLAKMWTSRSVSGEYFVNDDLYYFVTYLWNSGIEFGEIGWMLSSVRAMVVQEYRARAR